MKRNIEQIAKRHLKTAKDEKQFANLIAQNVRFTESEIDNIMDEPNKWSRAALALAIIQKNEKSV